MRRCWRSGLFKLGAILLVLGQGPLLAFIAADAVGLIKDPNPNPIGLGLLSFFTFWPSALLMAAGAWRVRRDGL